MRIQANSERLKTQWDVDVERLSYVERLLSRKYTEEKFNMTKQQREVLQMERAELVRKVRG